MLPGAVRTGEVNLRELVGIHTVVHALGHTLGFIHEHQRSCRNRYLKVNIDTINYICGIYDKE
ncbi:MAG: M12 family metallopeptidase [Solitalea-like symbiont of Acarus siro]